MTLKNKIKYYVIFIIIFTLVVSYITNSIFKKDKQVVEYYNIKLIFSKKMDPSSKKIFEKYSTFYELINEFNGISSIEDNNVGHILYKEFVNELLNINNLVDYIDNSDTHKNQDKNNQIITNKISNNSKDIFNLYKEENNSVILVADKVSHKELILVSGYSNYIKDLVVNNFYKDMVDVYKNFRYQIDFINKGNNRINSFVSDKSYLNSILDEIGEPDLSSLINISFFKVDKTINKIEYTVLASITDCYLFYLVLAFVISFMLSVWHYGVLKFNIQTK